MQTIEAAGTAKNPGQLVQSEGTERIMYSSFIIYLSKNVSKMRQYEVFTDITKVLDFFMMDVLCNIIMEFGIPMDLLIKICSNET